MNLLRLACGCVTVFKVRRGRAAEARGRDAHEPDAGDGRLPSTRLSNLHREREERILRGKLLAAPRLIDGGSGVAALYDAPARVPVGQLLVGCLRGASIVPLAYGAKKVAEAHGSGFFADVLRRAAPDKRVQAEYPVYYSAHTDPGSRHMADLFLASLERNGNGARVVPREATVTTAQRTMAERFGTKTTLVATALGAQPEGTYAAITELDVRFFAGVPIADLVDDALERCGDGCDGVFQREDDTSLHRNLGFMVIKVDRRVKKLFEHVGLAAATSGRVPGREKRATFPRPLSRPFPTRFG